MACDRCLSEAWHLANYSSCHLRYRQPTKKAKNIERVVAGVIFQVLLCPPLLAFTIVICLTTNVVMRS